jgi:hypothetical protein
MGQKTRVAGESVLIQTRRSATPVPKVSNLRALDTGLLKSPRMGAAQGTLRVSPDGKLFSNTGAWK